MYWQTELATELLSAPPARRKHILASYTERTGYSTQRLYTIAKQHGYTSGRKVRADKGQCVVNDQQLIFVAGLMNESAREKKGVIMPVEKALEIAMDERNGIITPGSISVARMQQLLREKQINKAALDADTPCTDMRSLHPNHVHQIDASVCIQYYLRDGKMALIDERDYNEKKPQNMAKIKTRLLRYLLTDHFSGMFYLKYYLADGESANNLYDFIISAWQHKQNEQYPFRGVPFLILWDAASAAKAKAMQHFIGGLGITTPAGRPHNPRRQGSVETTQNIVERHFESGLRFQPAFDVSQLNEWAYDWTTYFNAVKKHTRHGMKRTECWMLITQAQIRELPEREILNALYSYTSADNERLVRENYTITFAIKPGDVKTYHLKHVPGLLPTRSKVIVRIKPYLWPTVDVIYNEQAYEVAPVEMLPALQGRFRADAAIIGETYKAQPETLTQQAVKRIENYAYGEDRGKDAIPFAGIQVMGGHADKLENLAFIEKKGTPIEVDRTIADTQISIMELLRRLIAAVGPLTKEQNQALRAQYGESIDRKAADEVIALWQERQGANGVPHTLSGNIIERKEALG